MTNREILDELNKMAINMRKCSANCRERGHDYLRMNEPAVAQRLFVRANTWGEAADEVTGLIENILEGRDEA